MTKDQSKKNTQAKQKPQKDFAAFREKARVSDRVTNAISNPPPPKKSSSTSNKE